MKIGDRVQSNKKDQGYPLAEYALWPYRGIITSIFNVDGRERAWIKRFNHEDNGSSFCSWLDELELMK